MGMDGVRGVLNGLAQCAHHRSIQLVRRTVIGMSGDDASGGMGVWGCL